MMHSVMPNRLASAACGRVKAYQPKYGGNEQSNGHFGYHFADGDLFRLSLKVGNH